MGGGDQTTSAITKLELDFPVPSQPFGTRNTAYQNEDCDVATFGSDFRNTPEDVSEDDGHVWLPIDVARVVPGEARRGQGRPKAGDVR